MYLQFEATYKNNMEDEFMNVFVYDFIDVLQYRDWWDIGKISEEKYRKKLRDFKQKWFENIDEVRADIIENIKNEAIEKIRTI